MSSQDQAPPGPPYPPTVQALGGVPTISLDVPIASVFLVLFIGAAVGHMTIFQLNNRRGHRFIMSGMLFGFCMARITTMIMRIVWACYPTNVRIAIASGIFTAAGVLLLFVVNLLFAQRVVRATHPAFGWAAPFSNLFRALYISIPFILAMVITVTVQARYTLNPHTQYIDRSILLSAQTYLLFIAFLPLPLVALALAIPRTAGRKLDKFGQGRWRSKIVILLASAALLCTGAGFRVGTNFMTPTPVAAPTPWYFSKACFWIFNFTIETIVVYSYIIVRVDRRFHVPNASRKHGGYGAAYAAHEQAEAEAQAQQGQGQQEPQQQQQQQQQQASQEREREQEQVGDNDTAAAEKSSMYKRALDSIIPEEEFFDGETSDDLLAEDEEKASGRAAAAAATVGGR